MRLCGVKVQGAIVSGLSKQVKSLLVIERVVLANVSLSLLQRDAVGARVSLAGVGRTPSHL